MRYIMRRSCLFLVMIAVIVFTGCGQKKNEDPVTVTLWHVYGGQTESPLNDLIDEFNETIGKEKNIRVQVGSVTNTNTIHENVLASAFGDPGASKLPDMFVSYPKTVLAMPDDTELVDYYDYFTEEELNEFIPAFLEEGVIHERLSILPVAKSTEVMFINKTAFDRFAKETGAKIEDLKTWEGLFAMAEQYAAWTDNQTPDIPDDGKNFFVHDYHFNYFQVGVESLGEISLREKIWLSDRNFKQYGNLMQKRHCPEEYGFAAVMQRNLCEREIRLYRWLRQPACCIIQMKLRMRIIHRKK